MSIKKIIIEDIIEKLKNNAMFRLSLTSNELFHSNFLAWVFEIYKKECADIFEIPELKDAVIKREKNLGKNENGKKCVADIVIENDDNKIIIENKFKCIPDFNQLKDYEKLNPNCKIILLSYFEPLFKWNNYWSYKYLEEKLSELAENINDSDNKTIIKNYIKCIKLLNEIDSSINLEDNDKLCDIWEIIEIKEDENLKKELNAINFEKTLQRIYATKLTKYLLKNYDKKNSLAIFIDCGRDLTVYSDMLFCYKNAWAKNENEREKLNSIGVSVWGTNFRYYASINYKYNENGETVEIKKGDKINNNDKEQAYDILEKDYSWFFKQNNKWGGYRSEKEMYLYQKEDISNLNLKDLKIKVHKQLNSIYENEKNNGLDL